MIVDSFHIPVDLVAIIVDRKAPRRGYVFTTDLAPVAGLGPGIHSAFGGRNNVRIEEDLHGRQFVAKANVKGPEACRKRSFALQCLNWLWDERMDLGFERMEQIVRGFWTYPLELFGLQDDVSDLWVEPLKFDAACGFFQEY